MAKFIEVRFYDKDQKYITKVRAELEGDRYLAKNPPGDAVYASSPIDGHKLHKLPDRSEVRYG